MWGEPVPTRERHTTNIWKDRIRAQGIYSEGTRTASPYRRLKLVMDYWCALWFWPIEAAERLPDRDEFLNEIALVLTGSVYQPDLGPNPNRRPLREGVRRARGRHCQAHH